VENAIQHGLMDKMADGQIVIAGSIADGKLTLGITDNGKGMEEEKVNEITASLTKSYDVIPSSSIGLSNVHQRASILFGEGYGISVTSRAGYGTQVELTFPVMTKEEMERYVQSFHR